MRPAQGTEPAKRAIRRGFADIAEGQVALGLPSADELHDKVVEVLKAARTYHIPYRAAIAYDNEARLPPVQVPTLLACASGDMFMEYFERVQRLMPAATPLVTGGTDSAEALLDTVRSFEAFLDASVSNPLARE